LQRAGEFNIKLEDVSITQAGEAFVALRKIEASKAIVQSLSRNGHVSYIPSSGGNVLLNIPSNRK
jgi:prohibitin 1